MSTFLKPPKTLAWLVRSLRLGICVLAVCLSGVPLQAAEPRAKDAEKSTDKDSDNGGSLLVGWQGLRSWQHKDGKPASDWLTAGDVALHPQDNKKLAASQLDSLGIILNGQGKAANIYSTSPYGDISLHVEFLVPKASNSGIYLQGRYEIQILDSFGHEEMKYSDCGGIYEQGVKPNGFGGRAPNVNASLPPGEWQSFDIDFRAPRFDAEGKKTENAKFVRVVHNGKVIHENYEVTGPTRAAGFKDEQPTGPIMLQGDHGPVAFRNIRVRPLNKEAAKETSKE